MAKKSSQKKTAKRSTSPKGNGKSAAAASPAASAKKSTQPRKSGNNSKTSVLSKAELKELREMLLEKRRDIVGDMSGIQREAFKNRQSGSGDLSTMPTHLADIGSDNYEHEFSLGLLESERQLLKEIDEALDRMVSGTYGLCIGTGEPIGLPRLRARPWAKYCIEYARLIEKGLVRPDNRTSFAGFDDDADDDSDDDSDDDQDVDDSADTGDDEE